MTKKLWVTRDKEGYCIWTTKPKFDGSQYMDGTEWNKAIGSFMTYSDLRLSLGGAFIKPLAMNECKRIELTIKAEVKEL